MKAASWMGKVNSITRRETTTGRIRGTTAPLDAGARALRQRQTPTEAQLWECLRGHRLDGLPFRRQHPIGPFVVDFACPSRMLAIELDGSVHETMKDQDAARVQILSAYGWFVLRFENSEVTNAIHSVLDRIANACDERPIVHRRQQPNQRKET